jgi:hypothetical protein
MDCLSQVLRFYARKDITRRLLTVGLPALVTSFVLIPVMNLIVGSLQTMDTGVNLLGNFSTAGLFDVLALLNIMYFLPAIVAHRRGNSRLAVHPNIPQAGWNRYGPILSFTDTRPEEITAEYFRFLETES